MIQKELFDGLFITCQVIPMGRDYTIALYGGDRPHVGSLVLSVPRPSLTGEGISVTSSVLNGIGHKDEVVARIFAEALAKKYEATVACSCGIHVDQISPEGIARVEEVCREILQELLEKE